MSYHNFSGLDDLVEKAGSISGGSEKVRIAPLSGDGSDRKFFRIFCGSSSLIGLISPRVRKDGTDENDSYLLIGNHLHSKGLPVPHILYADAGRGRFILEDAGDLHLQNFVLSRRKNLESIYGHVVTMLGALHARAPEGFVPEFCFDSPLYDPCFVYERELEYFRNSFVNGCLDLEIAPDELRPDFEALAEAAGMWRSSFVFHRDFQSRNIMVRRARLWLLDFQGMRFGPPAYDLASLLIDPYVRLPMRLQDKLVSVYWSSAGWRQGVSKGDFIRKFSAVRLARDLQVLGAFGFLGIAKGKRRFLDYIPFAVDQLALHLLRTGQGQYPHLAKLVSDIRRRMAELRLKGDEDGFKNSKDRNNQAQKARSQ
ncbi:MAG TPA: phosphotransferase [Syntrophobacteraceae bacterium]|nr:phosphotransferase [Syntrophobacteraceae bacterium]